MPCRHQLFVDIVREHAATHQVAAVTDSAAASALGRLPNRPPDMPVYAQAFVQTQAL